MKYSRWLAYVLLCMLVSISSYAAPLGEMKLLLSTDFEGQRVKATSKTTADKIELKLPNRKKVNVVIQYKGGKPSDRYAKVVSDPTNKGNSVLKYWLKNAKSKGRLKGWGKKGRIQINLTNINKASVYEHFRMYLHPDLKHYSTYPKKNTWFTINEMWIGNTRDRKKHNHPFRISLTIAKEKGSGVPLRFFVHGDTQKKFRRKWKNDWYQANKEYEVPVGEWITVEIGYKQGNKETGRYYVAAKRDSEDTMTTIFNITDWTYSPHASKPAKLVAWNPLKLYTSANIINHIRKKGGVAQIYWDDMEIWEGDWESKLKPAR